MKCPRCSETELRQETVDDVVLDRCPNCGGMWFNQAVFDKVADAPPRKLVETDRVRCEASDSVRLVCPSCTAQLIKLSVIKKPAVAIFGCPVCYGRWIDGGRLALFGKRSLFVRLWDFVSRRCR